MDSLTLSVKEDGLTSEDKFFWLDIPEDYIIEPNDYVENDPSEVGRGAYGKVKKFEWMGQQCCAKLIHRELIKNMLKNPKPLQYFRTEVTTWASRLKHTNIVQFLGGWQGGGNIAIVMEMLTYTLDKFLAKQEMFGIPTILKRSILRDISSAMMYVHSYEIFHRDLTSMNVLLTSTLIAKVSDFGMAKFYEKGGSHTVTPGNMHFMPPEVRVGGEKTPYDKSIDPFSFGCIALHVTTLKFPEPVCEGDFNDQGQQVYTAIECRWEYFKKLAENEEEEREFLPIIKPCLGESEKRPSFEEIHSMLSQTGKPSMAEKREEMFKAWLEDKSFEQSSEKNHPQPASTSGQAGSVNLVLFFVNIMVVIVALLIYKFFLV